MYKLKDYQSMAKDVILKNEKCALFIDMGLGKTLTTLSALETLFAQGLINSAIIVAPKSVALCTWQDEIKKWGINLTFVNAFGTPKQRLQAVQQDAQLYITTYDQFQDVIKMRKFDMCVCDEYSMLKNHATDRFKSFKKVPFIRFVGLTGTPAPNDYMSLWALLYLLDDGQRLGKNITSFRQLYCRQKITKTERRIWEIVPQMRKVIDKKINDICFSLLAGTHTTEVQATYINHELDVMTNAYKTLNNAYIFNNEVYENVLQRISMLQQMSNGLVYTDAKNDKYIELHDVKIKKLQQIVSESGNVLVFCNYRHEMLRLQRLFDCEIADEKGKFIDRWNKGEIKMLVLNPASAGHGLNLQQGGHVIVWLSLTWSLEQYLQANARLIRQGQTQHVIVHHLIGKYTVDQRIIKALERKENIQDKLMKGVEMID